MDIAMMINGGELGAFASLEVHMAGGGNRAHMEQWQGIPTKPIGRQETPREETECFML